MSETIYTIRNLVGLAAFIILIAACSAKPAKAPDEKKAEVPTVSQEAHYVANEADASYVTEIRFKKTSDKIPAEAQKDLKRIYDEAKKKGTLSEAKVISWADLEYPAPSTKKLSKAEIELANKRNKSIKSYLTTFDKDLSVNMYNMAERPNTISEILSTENNRIKNSLEVAGIPNTNTAIKVPSKASHAIVMIILKDN